MLPNPCNKNTPRTRLLSIFSRFILTLALPAAALLLLIGLLGHPSTANADAAPITWQRPAPLADPTPISETPLLTLTGEAGTSIFGISVASAGDVNGDGFADVLVGAPAYSSTQGRAYLYLGSAAGLSATPALTFAGEADSQLGYSVASAGDVNKDGYADILIGAPAYSSSQGRAYLYLGSVAGLSATPALTLTGEASSMFGMSVASAGDVNGDGFADALIGAPNYSSTQGCAYLYLGNTIGLTTTPALTLTGEAISDNFGASVASAGDVNADGWADVIVGAYNYNGGQGRAYLYLGNTIGLTATPALTLTGEAINNYFGFPVASAGDVNGDGLAEIIVGAQYWNGDRGRVYLYLGSTTGLTTTPAITLTGEANSSLGVSVASAGDVNKDGYADMLVGAYLYNSEQGRAYLHLGNTTGLTTTPALTLTGEAVNNFFGASVASAGDVNGDGWAEIIVGAYNYNGGQGRAYLYGYRTVPDLVVAKTAFPEPVVAGTALTYTLVITNQGDVTATNTILTDALPLSATLQAIDQVDNDNDALGFGGGAHDNTLWRDPWPDRWGEAIADEWLELDDTLLNTGVFTSRVFDAGNVGVWTSLSWTPRRPYGKPLPDNRAAETAYSLGNADMVGNRVLLHLDEAAAPFADASGLGHDGACSGASCPATDPGGRFSAALAFDGADDTVIISDTIDPARYALELWVYPAAVADTSLILRTDALSGTAALFSHLLGISGGKFIHLTRDEAGNVYTVTGSTDVQVNTWYHLVGTAESNGDIKLYVNGVQEGSPMYPLTVNVGPLWAGGDQYALGSSYGLSGTVFFNGRLDEVAVYARTLSASEIADHYLRGALRLSFQVRTCTQPGCTDDPAWSAAYTDNATDDLPQVTFAPLLADARYFQYRATFETDDDAYTPQVRRVQVDPPHYRVEASQGGCVTPDTAQAFTCTLGTLAPGAVATVTAWTDIHPSALGVITNTAGVTATGEISPADNLAVVTSTAVSEVRLHVSKYDDDRDLPCDVPIAATWSTGARDPVNPGSVLTYTLAVYNDGPSTAWDVTVTDTLPISVSGLITPTGWTCVWVSETITCTMPSLYRDDWEWIAITGAAPVVSGTITNTAWISAAVSTVYTTSQLTDTEDTLVVPLADLDIDKTAAPDPVDPGQTITFAVTVTNGGPYTATGVILTDTLPDGMVGYPIASTLWPTCTAPGQVVVCEFAGELTPTQSASLLITATAPMSGLIENNAFVTSTIADPDDLNNWATAYAAVRPVADLAVLKADAPDPVDAAAPLTYTLTVSNAGPVAAGAITSALSLRTHRNIRIPIGGEAQPYPSGLYLDSVPGLVREITVTLYGLYHTYPGDLAALLVGPDGQTALLMGNAGGGADADGINLTFHEDGQSLPMSGTLTSTLVYRPTNYGFSEALPAPAPAGPYGDSLAGFYGRSPNGVWLLYVYDTVDSDGGRIANGWGLQIVAVTTDTVTLSDTLPAGLNGASVDSPAGWDCAAGADMLCQGDRLEIGQIVTFSITATAPITGGVITNTAAVTSTIADLSPVDNTAYATTTVRAIADLGLIKSANAISATPGSAIQYTLLISNAGPSPVSSAVVVTDMLPAGLRNVSAAGSGWACDITALPYLTCTASSLAIGPAPDILISANAPLTHGWITNTAGITTSAMDPALLNNTASASIEITSVVSGAAVYLPTVFKNHVVAPDLVIERITATTASVQVVVRNQGYAPVVDEFWVDVYINPTTPPSVVNQTWRHLGSQGLVWGITSGGLPLQPGAAITLTASAAGGAYYRPDLSAVTWPLAAGTPIYAQADSAHAGTTYGAVLENHEITTGLYNNISGPVNVP